MPNGRDRFQFDEAALAQIENIRRIGLRRLRNKNEIDDFVQETLLRAFSKRSQLRDAAKFEAWIAAIARNLAREWNRAYYRRKRAEADSRTADAVDSRNPLDALEKAEERELLKQAVARLNESDREILRARYVDDASYAELQERYGLSYSAVGLRLHRAKKRLRKIYLSIAAALSLFFGSFKHTAWGGMLLMKKTAAIAVGIGVLIGALGVGFFWMQGGGVFWKQNEGGAALENSDKASSTDSTLTAQTTDNPETLNGSNSSESSDSKPEHSERSRQNEAMRSQEEGTVNLDLTTRRFDAKGDIGDFHATFRETMAAMNRVKEGELKLSELYALIDGYEFNSDWKMYLRISVMKKLGLPLSRLEKKFHTFGGDALTSLLRKRWNAENDVISPQLNPIGDTWKWAKEHAPSEYETVFKRYHRLIRQDTMWLPLSVERYLLPEERVNRLYNFFFEALAELPQDAKMFTEYFDGVMSASSSAPVDMPPAPLPPESPRIGLQKPPVAVEAPMRDSSDGRGASRMDPPSIPSSPTPSDDFEASALESIERYGVHEGLRRLAESHPWWESRVAQWAQQRQKRLSPSPPPNDERR